MSEILFYVIAAFTLLTALMVPLSRNPVNGAVFMIGTFAGTAALFALLGAFFLAILQILIYAGAVVVLFLFIIMLINPEHRARWPSKPLVLAGSVTVLLLLTSGIFYFLSRHPVAPLLPPLEKTPVSLTRSFGELLFTKYLLPVQMIGFLLLMSMVGVIHIAKRPAPASRTTAPRPTA